MFTTLLLGAKALFGGIFRKILSDWRILLAICLTILGVLVMLKIKNLESDLNESKEQVKVEKKNNETLRGNVAILQDTNNQNKVVIDQITDDKQIAIKNISKLSSEIIKTNKSISELHQKINEIKVEPTKLTPYISQAVDGIQKERDELQRSENIQTEQTLPKLPVLPTVKGD